MTGWLVTPDPYVSVTLAGIGAILVSASAILLALRRRYPARDWRELTLRIRSWWIIVGISVPALLLSATASIIFLAVVSYLALKEYLSIIPTRQADRAILLLAYLAVPIQAYWIVIGSYGMFIIFVPVYMFLVLPTAMVMRGETRGFLRAVGTLHWGLMQTVFAIGHAAFLVVLPEVQHGPIRVVPTIAIDGPGGAGLLLMLILITQLNDVAQYVWGRLFGLRRISPSVSPNKTVAGFVGGVVTTIVVSAAVGPYLTPMDVSMSLAAGGLVAVAGFLGDLSVSAVKRDLQIKDTGAAIPGHGGVLDRIDSLTFAAPVFFHFMRFFYY